MCVCFCVSVCVMVNVQVHCCGCEYFSSILLYYFIVRFIGCEFCNICLNILKFKSLATLWNIK